MEEQQESFGERLRRLRESAGLSQESLAERAGLSANAISAIERGERKRPYPDTIRRLADALGLDTGERGHLVDAVRSGRRNGTTGETGVAGPAPTALPMPPDALLGRESEVTTVCDLLCRGEYRLLTLTGPGGIGKTRLALHLAHLMHDNFPDGIAWVDLAPLSDATLVLPAISKTLGIRTTPGELTYASLQAAIGARRTLMVLDNAEHVRDAAPDIADLLHHCAGLKMLATSRAPLDVRGEQQYAVPPLSLPPAGNGVRLESLSSIPSVQLFVRAVQLKLPSFQLEQEHAEAIATICRRLDGVPLALELAAARVPLLGIQALRERLDAVLPLLTGGKQDLPSRQRTMESTIRWSYDLLSQDAQHLFRVLSVFSGGWTLDAAETVAVGAGCADLGLFDGLAILIDHSLVRRIDDARGRPRYTMMETFREFARQRLREAGEEADAVRAHLCWMMSFAGAAEPHLVGPAQDYWLDQLANEHDNLRAALGSGLPGAEGDRVRLAGSSWRFWYMRGYFAEGRTWLERCIEQPGDAIDDTIATALNGAGILAQESGDFASAETFYNRALSLRRSSGDTRGLASTLSNLGLLADHRGDYDRAIALYEESLGLCKEPYHPSGVANALNNLGLVYRDLGDFARARELHQQSLPILRSIGDQRSTANALNNLGNIAGDLGEVDEAISLHKESLAIRERLDDRPGIAMSLKNLGNMARLQGDTLGAAALYEHSLAIRRDLADLLGAIPTLGDVAALASTTGHHDVAVGLVTAIRAVRNRLGAPPPPAASATHERIMLEAERLLSPDEIERARRFGDSLGGEQVIDEATAFLVSLQGQ